MKALYSLRLRVHRANLERFARLLPNNLSESEREYIHRRIAEEHSAIAKLEEYLTNAGQPTEIRSSSGSKRRSSSDVNVFLK